MKARTKEQAKRYAAKLLFQFRVGPRGWSKRRICEERIVLLNSHPARAALSAAKSSGKAAQFSYENPDGRPVHFEFIGVMDLLRLGPECGSDEVCYDIKEMLLPMERRRRLIPDESRLNAVRNGQ